MLALCRTRRKMVAGLAALVVSFSAPGDTASAQDRKLKVVTTVSMLADAVREVGGVRVDVSSLMNEGVDPHTYRPTRADMARLAGADLIIGNGLNLEAQLTEPLKALSRTKPVIFAAESVPTESRLADPDYPGQFDPHVWMDPKLWTIVIAAVSDALSKRDPAGKEHYAKGAKAYAEVLAQLDAYSRQVLTSVAASGRVLITAHDAFGYFGRAYGFEVEGVQGLSTESEAGLKRIEELVRLVVERKIPAAFFESSVPDRNIRALIEGAAARGHRLAIGGELYSDALGAPGTYEGTLVGMIDHNVTTIARALGGTVPERGMAGKLKTGG